MRQILKNKLKEQKGLTLIELLAVIVILGIIAAIAVPSILGLIDNTKKDAHVANAQQMINAAKMAIASESDLQTGTDIITLKGLEDKKYLDPVDSPDSGDYSKGSDVTISSTVGTTSYVKIEEGKITEVNLVVTKTEADSSLTKTRYITKTDANGVSPTSITRTDVKPN